MIIDVFMYNDEIDHLQCRMYELKDVVDYHIAVEGNRTMAGAQKPWYLNDKIQKYDDTNLIVISADISDISGVPDLTSKPWVTPETNVMWQRDWKQRNAVMPHLDGLPGDTVVIYSDVDEIPSREIVLGYQGDISYTLGMKHLIYSMRRVTPGQWIGPTIGRKWALSSFAEVRANRWSFSVLPKAGWHLGWFGGPDAIEKKIGEYAHGEMVGQEEKIKQYAKEGRRPADGTELEIYNGVIPAWVGDGHAPDSWFMY
jgi:beta-1,4-mannosyl-glycoprotein beta-1,4-N-acetylglucosaminyltransferase